MEEQVPVKRPTLADAAVTIERIVEEFGLDSETMAEDKELFSEDLRLALTESLSSLSNAVDRRIVFFEYLELAISHAKKNRDVWSQRARTLEKTEGFLKASTLSIVKATPEIEFSGSLGTIKAQRNGKASLETDFKTSSYTLSNVVDASDIAFYGIEEGFYEPVAFYQLRTDLIRDAINDGHEFDWASLKTGEHLRVTLPSMKQAALTEKKLKSEDKPKRSRKPKELAV